jgi:regulator of RNase E activity RraA
MVEHDVQVVVGGVTVSPGDLVIADVDGIVAVPATIAPEVVRRALEKVSTEDGARDLLERGALLREVFDRFRVL